MSARSSTTTDSRRSLASSAVALIGTLFAFYGLTGLIFGSAAFGTDGFDGTVQGERWLALEANGWTNVLFLVAGVILLAAAPADWSARTLALIVASVFAAAAIVAAIDGDDVVGTFAANGWTILAWAVAAVVLILVAMVPRMAPAGRQADEGLAPDGPASLRTVDREPAGRRRR